MVINTKETDLSTQMVSSSGDLVSCETMPFVFEVPTTSVATEAESSEETTTTEEVVTEAPEIVGFTPPDENLIEIFVRPGIYRNK